MVIFYEIQLELEIIKSELETRLEQENNSPYFITTDIKKDKMVLNAIQDDLIDVNCALEKIKNGNFGICEMTGAEISIELLKIIPTARTIYDFPRNWAIEMNMSFYQWSFHPLHFQ